MTWRERARPVIAEVLAANPGLDEKALRKVLRAAYPFGQLAYHPYRTWCDEINVQLGKKRAYLATVNEPRPIASLPGQMSLFGE